VTLPSGITSISDDIQNTICHQIWNRTNGTITIHIQMYGNKFLHDSSSITVYNGKTLQGDEWTFDKSSDYPNVNVYMQSYFFTGSKTSWLLFNDTNYNGTSTCLEPAELAQRYGFGVTYSGDERINIKSIRSTDSCPSDEPEPDYSGVSYLKIWKEGLLFGSMVALCRFFCLRN